MTSLLWIGILLLNKYYLKHKGLEDDGPIGFTLTMFVDIIGFISFYEIMYKYAYKVLL
jgi:hypothetical protein